MVEQPDKNKIKINNIYFTINIYSIRIQMRDYFLEKYYEEYFVTESRKNRYKDMFEGLGIPEEHYIDEIDWAIKTLKREDRIIWFLRWFKTCLLGNIESVNNELAEKWLKAYAKKMITTNNGNTEKIPDVIELWKTGTVSFSDIRRLKIKLEHLLSLPISEIQNYKFNYQTIHTIIDDLEDFEREWKKSRKEWIDITEELEDGTIDVIHDFNDGFVWLNLNKAYCELEGDAMGHCGNAPRESTEDKILSLRKIKKENGQILSRPSVTFILNENRNLTEMKGRGNSKPDPKYHPYIIKLLTLKYNNDWLVNKLIGGEYLSENDFEIEDLNEELKKELFKVRPDLKPLRQIYLEDGITEVVLNKIKTIDGFLGIKNNIAYYKGYDSIKDFIDTFEGKTSFTGKNVIEKISSYYPYIVGDKYIELYDISVDSQERRGLFKEYLSKYKNEKQIAEYLIEDLGLDGIEDEEQLFYIFDDNYGEILNNAYHHGYESGTSSEMYNSFSKEFIDGLAIEAELEDGNIFTGEVVLKDNNLDSELLYRYDLKTKGDCLNLLEIIDRLDRSHYESIKELLEDGENYDIDDMYEPYHGFGEYDESVAIERLHELLEEEGIVD